MPSLGNMKTLTKFLLLAAIAARALGAANDIKIQQNSGGVSFPDRIFAAQSAVDSTLASYQSAIGLGLEDSPQFTALTLSGLTAGRVPIVTMGGLLTSSASLTFNSGTGALSATNFIGTFAGNTFTTGTGTLTLAAAKVFTVNNTLTLAGTDGTTMTFPSTNATIARTDAANSFSGTQTFAGPVVITNGIGGAGDPGSSGGTSSGSAFPITLYVKSVTVKTSGSPADIATITVPAGITRWRIVGIAASTTTSTFIAETAAGTLAGAAFESWTAAGGTGTQIHTSAVGPTAATNALAVGWAAQNTSAAFTAGTITIRQTANSANAGTISFYITIYPLP